MQMRVWAGVRPRSSENCTHNRQLQWATSPEQNREKETRGRSRKKWYLLHERVTLWRSEAVSMSRGAKVCVSYVRVVFEEGCRRVPTAETVWETMWGNDLWGEICEQWSVSVAEGALPRAAVVFQKEPGRRGDDVGPHSNPGHAGGIK